MAYENRALVRTPENVCFNDFERMDGKRVAALLGTSWGQLKRELINAGVRRVLHEYGEKITAVRHADQSP